jgi:RHS repeat-associated protein
LQTIFQRVRTLAVQFIPGTSIVGLNVSRRWFISSAVHLGFAVLATWNTQALAQASVATPPACVWVAYLDGLYQVQSDTNLVSRILPLKDVDAAAMNGNDCGVAAIAEGKLYRYTANGEERLNKPLGAISTALRGPAQMLSDPHDDSLWIADDKNLVRVDADGSMAASWAAPERIRAIALALDRTVWVLGNKQLWQVDSSGVLLAKRDLHDSTRAAPVLLVYDSFTGIVWLGGEKDLTRIDLDHPDVPPQHIALPQTLTGLALDQLTGELWVATADWLLSYGADGRGRTELGLPAGTTASSKLAFDPVNRSVWLAAKDALIRQTPGGAPASFAAGAGLPRALAAPAFMMTPALRLVRPADGGLGNDAQPRITYHVTPLCNGRECAVPSEASPGFAVSATLDGQAISPFLFDSATGDAIYTTATRLVDGRHLLSAQAKDRFGQASPVVNGAFTIDTVPPSFTSVTPASGSVLTVPAVTIEGSVDDPSATVVLDGKGMSAGPADGADLLRFSFPVSLEPGDNHFGLSAVDKAGNLALHALALRFVPPPPVAPVASKIQLGKLAAGMVALMGNVGAVAPGLKVVVTNGRTQAVVVATADANGVFSLAVPAAAGDVLFVRAVDIWGGSSAAIQLAVQGEFPIDPDATPGVIPPDPAGLAPRVDPSVPTSIAASTAFLYSGPNAIQTGVPEGTIKPGRVAVIRGRVINPDGSPQPAVRVRVLGHPEYGQTHSRADGRFDLVVNGGGLQTLTFDRTGVLPAQRSVQTPWKDFVSMPDVALIPLDGNVTRVDLSASQTVQVAQGSKMTDASGTRQASLLFKPGTTATMRLKDGSVVPLPSISVRATEYTVGKNGPASMPGALPATSGYTYAVELSADEAIAAGAKEVNFSQPVALYVDNFLKFPAGEVVPTGYYDRNKAAWVPSANGRVIKVLAIEGGIAKVDLTGAGSPADAAALAALGIGELELRELAARYPVNTTLWRVMVTHFTPYDCNWPFGPPDDATAPSGCDLSGKCLGDEQHEDNPCVKCGSVIQVQNQILGESVPLVGTPFRLHYNSDKINRKLHIPLSGATVPASLNSIDLTITVAGQVISRQFPASSGQVFEFEWDGLDAYGRPVVGITPVDVKIGYTYLAGYYSANRMADDAFAQLSDAGTFAEGDRRSYITIGRAFTLYRIARKPEAGLGGWDLDAHYTFDPAHSGRLVAGDGTTQSAQTLNVASAAASMGYSTGIAVDADGNIYNGSVYGIRKIGSSGNVETVTPSFNPQSLARDQLGNFYVTYEFFASSTLYRYGPDGTSTPLIGDGFMIPKAQQQDVRPRAITVDRDGTIYFAQNVGIRNGYYVGNCYIKKLSTGGKVTIVAGDGQCEMPKGDDGPAAKASLRNTQAMAIDSKGNLYVADSYAVRKIATDGTIRIFAGVGYSDSLSCNNPGVPPDGQAALDTCIGAITGLAVDREDRVLISSYDFYQNNQRRSLVRRVNADGTIGTLALAKPNCAIGTGVPLAASVPAQSLCSSDVFGAIAVNPNNETVVALGENTMVIGNGQVRCVGANGAYALDCNGMLTAAGDKVYASSDGKRLFTFDSSGRHYRTSDSRTNAVIHELHYDAQGNLSDIRDANGNVTTFERDAQGRLTGIVGPDGLRTRIELDQHGYIQTITNPNGETYKLTTSASGLLERFESPRQLASVFAYDDEGRLIHDQNAAGGFWNLQRTVDNHNALEINVSSAMGRTTRYRMDYTASGGKIRTTVHEDGSQQTTKSSPDGTTLATSPDGTVTTTVSAPDPRFGMQVPYERSRTIRLPGGLTYSSVTTRSATLNIANDPLSLQKESTVKLVNGKQFKLDYDALLHQYTMTSPMNRQTLLQTDEQGRPRMSQPPGLPAITYNYDARGRLERVTQGTGAIQRTQSYEYDAQGFVGAVTDTLVGKTSYSYDLAGHITRVALPDSRVMQLSYDANGNLTSVTPPGRPAHSFDYNRVDAVEGYRPPSIAGAILSTQYEYNLDKQITGMTRPDGQRVDYGYDESGRRRTTISPAGTVVYDYDAKTGQLSAVTAPADIKLEYAYDGELLTGVRTAGAVPGSVSFGYDNFFRISRVGVNADDVSFGYDNDGVLTSAGALTLVPDPVSGLIQSTQLGQIAASRRYNDFGGSAGTTVKYGTTVLYDEQLQLGEGGRLEQKSVTKGGISNVYGYGYDAVGRLTDVTKDGVSIGHFDYDANGNRTKAYGFVSEYDDQDRLSTFGGAHYEYTANGELKVVVAGADRTAFEYDAFGNLRHVTLPDGTQLDYVVDGLNRRIGKKVNGVLQQGFLYQDQIKPVAELDAAGKVVARFVYAGRPNVPEYMVKAGVTYQMLTDHLGSVQMVVNSTTGEVVQRIDYDDWGNVLSDSNPGFQPFGFAGGLYDHDTGLVRFGARDYDPKTARWTAKDQTSFAGGDSNLYAYVNGNPTSYIDPFGFGPWDKLYGLPKAFWKWFHTEDGGKLIKELKDASGQVPEKDAREWHEIWKKEKEGGFVDPEIFEWVVPWWLTSSEMGCSTLDCHPEYKSKPEKCPTPGGR